MNPKEFNWLEDQMVTVINPTDTDHWFKVHNKEYCVKAGATAKMPGYIAWNYVYTLSNRECQKDNKFIHWNEEGFRQTYYEKFVKIIDDVVQEVVVEPNLVEIVDEPSLDDTSTTKRKKTIA